MVSSQPWENTRTVLLARQSVMVAVGCAPAGSLLPWGCTNWQAVEAGGVCRSLVHSLLAFGFFKSRICYVPPPPVLWPA